MVFASWRGVVGVVKPTHRPGSLEEFIRLLPEGIGVVPVYLNFQRGTEDEFRAALNAVHEKVAELAKEGVDLIHPEGAPPFMVHGFKGEEKIVKEWEAEFKIPIVTAAQTQVEALRALGVKKIRRRDLFHRQYQRYVHPLFSGSGIRRSRPWKEWKSRLPTSAAWRRRKSTRTRAELSSKIPAPMASICSAPAGVVSTSFICSKKICRCRWFMRCRRGSGRCKNGLHVRQAVKGFGKLLEEMP